jgi:hypothetical protein
LSGDEHRPKVTRSWMIRQGQEIPIDRLDLELTPLDSGERNVFASAHTNTKVLGLSPGQSDLQLILEWEGQLYEIAEATVFDVELHVSGETTVQVTGKLRPVKSREG